MRSSKELFQSSPAFQDYQKMIASPSFEPSCNAALLAMIEELPPAADVARTWDAYLQIVGARRLIEQLASLHLKEEPTKKVKYAELDYGVNKQRP